MLIYNPAQDPYHAIFRALQILEENKDQAFHIQQFRILDFYLLFPGELANLRYPRPILGYKSEFKKLNNPYNHIENPVRVFHQLETLQKIAIYSLAKIGIVEYLLLKNHGLVKRSILALDSEVAQTVKFRSTETGNLIHFLANELSAIPFGGTGGLKDRSGLIEYRYDLISS